MNNDLLLSSVEPQISVVVREHHIACVEPSVDDRFGRRRRIIPIANRISGKTNPNAAVLARRKFGAPIVADREFVSRARLSDGALAEFETGRGDCRMPCLGHPVAFVDRAADQFGILAFQFGGNLIPSGEAYTDGRKVVLCRPVIANQGNQSGREHEHHRRPAAAQQRQNFVTVAAARHGQPPAGGQYRHAEH